MTDQISPDQIEQLIPALKHIAELIQKSSRDCSINTFPATLSIAGSY